MLPLSLLLNHLYQYRRYLWKNAWNDLRYRYAGTGIGIFWNFIDPIFEILVYTFVFSYIFPSRGSNYLLYLCSGLLPWRAFAETINRGANAFKENAIYLRRLAITSEIFVAKSALTSTFILGLYCLILLVVNSILGNHAGWQIIILPILICLFQVMAFGMTLILANLRILLPDIAEIIRALLPLWSWTIPIIYPQSILPDFIHPFLYFNPPFAFIESIRNLILYHQIPSLKLCFFMFFWCIFFMGLGVIVNYLLKGEVRNNI